MAGPRRSRVGGPYSLAALALALGCGASERNAGEDAGTGSSTESTASATTGLPNDPINLTEGAGGGGAQCRRVVEFEGITLQVPPAFDLVIVADNSESLSWSREDLADGLSDLMANVYGHAVRIFVLSPTQYGPLSAHAVDLESGEPLVNWKDPVSDAPYTHEVTRYVATCTDSLGQELLCPDYPTPNLEFELEGTWEFVMPDPVAELDSGMTLAELDLERAKVADAILALGVEGSPEEQPVCTLTRYLEQPARLLPERAVFLVISDEDDTASAAGCLGSYHYQKLSSNGSRQVYGCTQDCEGYRFSVDRLIGRTVLDFACAPVDDLGPIMDQSTWEPGSLSLSSPNGCETPLVRDCDENETTRVQNECPGGYVVQTCTHTCTDNSTRQYCSYTSADPDVDLCTQPFMVGENSYSDFLDFCESSRQATGWGSCTRDGYTTSTVAGQWSDYGTVDTVVGAKTVDDMVYLFRANADRAFGEDNYAVEAIVFTEDGPCVPATGQSYATNLSELASSPAQVYPICESYTPALGSVKAFAQELLRAEYPLELGERESIESVVVEGRDGSTRELSTDEYQFDQETGVLTIDQAAIQASDLNLSVEVLDPCAPPIK